MLVRTKTSAVTVLCIDMICMICDYPYITCNSVDNYWVVIVRYISKIVRIRLAWGGGLFLFCFFLCLFCFWVFLFVCFLGFFVVFLGGFLPLLICILLLCFVFVIFLGFLCVCFFVFLLTQINFTHFLQEYLSDTGQSCDFRKFIP